MQIDAVIEIGSSVIVLKVSATELLQKLFGDESVIFGVGFELHNLKLVNVIII
jgi:hypothetical protein